jgi:phosphopentomutase
MAFKRVFVIVLDSLGIGESEDAHLFGDTGAHTIKHINDVYPLHIPNLVSLGYGNISKTAGIKETSKPKAHVGMMRELSNGKDTLTGHWELMGIETKEPLVTFTDNGFPKELLDELILKTGHQIVGNISASGTDIIDTYGEHHMKTKDLIVYTSADSVLQIAMHESIIPIERQYEISQIARDITMKPEWKVGRVITRPFIGNATSGFTRTTNRKDYALKPSSKTALNFLEDKGLDVIALGKIVDIFDHYGITEYKKTTGNDDGMVKLNESLKQDFTGLCFLNLVDFDALYGHRRDPIGYGKAIEAFDIALKSVLEQLHDDDLLIITADHGNDPTFKGSDHTREFVPLICFHNKITKGVHIPIRDTFADLAQTICENFDTEKPSIGTSFLNIII